MFRLNVVGGDSLLLSGKVGEDDLRAFFAAEQAAHDVAVFFRDEREPEGAIDVAVWIEDVLAQTRGAASADAVELRANGSAFAFDRVADGAVFREDFRAASGAGFGGIDRSADSRRC